MVSLLISHHRCAATVAKIVDPDHKSTWGPTVIVIACQPLGGFALETGAQLGNMGAAGMTEPCGNAVAWLTGRFGRRYLGQLFVSPSTLPTSNRKFSNGPITLIASIFGPLNSRRPNIMARIGPYSPRPI